jgi:hypothetical protein
MCNSRPISVTRQTARDLDASVHTIARLFQAVLAFPVQEPWLKLSPLVVQLPMWLCMMYQLSLPVLQQRLHEARLRIPHT